MSISLGKIFVFLLSEVLQKNFLIKRKNSENGIYLQRKMEEIYAKNEESTQNGIYFVEISEQRYAKMKKILKMAYI